MKNILMALFVTSIALNAFALDRRLVESKTCDGNQISLAANEAILFEESKSLIAFKQDDESGCAKADFYLLMVTSFGDVNGDKVSIYQPAMAAGGKNCKNEMLPAAPIFFESLTMKANSVELTNANGCALLIYNLKAKEAAAPQ